MWSLARPVTADETCYGARHNKYADDYEGSLHHIKVPLILPNAMLTATAEMNMPAMMYTKSI